MRRKTSPPVNAENDHFVWVGEPEFVPPDADDGMATCVQHEISPPRQGELGALLATFLESIIGTVNATAGVVRLLTPDGSTLQIISSAALSVDLLEEAENFVELDCEVSGNATLGHIVHSSDVSACDSRQNCRHASCRFQSLVATPIEAPNNPGVLLGILTVFFDVPREAANQSMNIVAAFAETMGATIEHTRINRENSRAERLAARQEIANEIHDSLAQTLTYARMRLSLLHESLRSGNTGLAAKYARDVDEALESGQRSARALIADFRINLPAGGLLPALQDLVDQFSANNDIVLEYHNRLADLDLPLEFEIQVFHIVREALTNIARHSGATHARLFVDSGYGYYVFTVEDNGRGASTFTPVEGHYGLLIMEERAKSIGGAIKMESTRGLGTQVQLFFPAPPTDWRRLND